MESKDWIGVGIFVTAVAFSALLFRLKFVRRDPLLLGAILINPGLVGVLAACAFWLRNTSYTIPCWIGSMLLMVPSTIAVMLAVPKAYSRQIAAEAKSKPETEDQAEQPSERP